MRNLGASEADAARTMHRADTDGDGSVSFDEFKALAAPVYAASGAALRSAFDYFDADSSGYIDRSELSLMLRKLGFGWQGGGVFAAADADHDGRVSFDEFIALFADRAAAPAATATAAGARPPPLAARPRQREARPRGS